MRTAANFIIEGRMRPYGRRLCTVGLILRRNLAILISRDWQPLIRERVKSFFREYFTSKHSSILYRLQESPSKTTEISVNVFAFL